MTVNGQLNHLWGITNTKPGQLSFRKSSLTIGLRRDAFGSPMCRVAGKLYDSIIWSVTLRSNEFFIKELYTIFRGLNFGDVV